MPLVYRSANTEDMTDIVTILVDNFSQAPYNKVLDRKDLEKEVLEDIENQSFYLVGEKDATVVGFITGHFFSRLGKPRALIKAFFVSPDLQGKGIGTGLMNQLKNLCSDKGIYKIELVVHQDAPAVSFYEKHQFNFSELLHFEYKIEN